MVKKLFVFSFCFAYIISTISLCTSSAISLSNNMSNEDINISVVKKDMKTNLVQQENYIEMQDGSLKAEIIETWEDTTLTPSKEVEMSNVELFKTTAKNIFGTEDNRILVTNTQQFPYSAIVCLDIHYGLATRRGTGFLIADDIVVTAGHNLYSSNDGWATSVSVRPGRNGFLSLPYGLAVSEECVVSAEWYVKGLYNYDWGLIHISDSLIGDPGTFTFSPIEDTFEAIPAMISGYPLHVGSNSPIRYKQYKMSGTVYIWDEHNFHYIIDTSEGQSGAPILNSNNTVIGIHSHGEPAWNTGVRITPSMYLYFHNYISQNGGT